MSRTVSTAYKAFLRARARGDGTGLLLRVDHADTGTLRFAQNAEDLVSDGDTYEARGFQLPLPMDEDGIQESPLTLDITTLEDDVVDDLLAATGDRPTVEADLVLLSDPDTEEATFYFAMKSATADAGVLRGALVFEPVLGDLFGDVFDAARFPDLFE